VTGAGFWRPTCSTSAGLWSPSHNSCVSGVVFRPRVVWGGDLIISVTFHKQSGTWPSDLATYGRALICGRPTKCKRFFEEDWHSQKKIGVEDVIIDKSGKVTAVIISVGGFLGIDSKDVAAPFSVGQSYDERIPDASP
jgi:PRC-barrel domain protein